MSESVLKKEFQQRDIERMRNLMKGKHGDKQNGLITTRSK